MYVLILGDCDGPPQRSPRAKKATKRHLQSQQPDDSITDWEQVLLTNLFFILHSLK